ncbi:MAG: MmgE/PrpD family protein [Janthinobacterium lividum]
MSRMPLSVRLIQQMNVLRQRTIPAEIRRKTCAHIADAVGIALAASAGGGLSNQLLDAISCGADGGRCRVLGSNAAHAPSLAAFANAALIHILDFDDIHDAARLHPTAVTLPAALAAAALVDVPASRVVDAVALGNELMCRLGVMCSPTGEGPGSDWFLTQLFGYLGAALAMAIVLDLDEAQIVSSFGLAYMQAAGGKEAGFGVGATSRGIYPAFAAMGGTHASLLARAGIVGPATALDGAAGLFKLYLGGMPSAAQINTLLDGQHWRFAETQTKPWPSCRLSHPYVAVALALREQLGDSAPAHVLVKVNGSAAKLCRPLAERRRPQTLQDAKYSIPYMTAFTLAKGRVDLQTLHGGVLDDVAIQALAERVAIEESLADKPGHPPAEIIIRTGDGRTLHSDPMPDLDMDEAAMQSKFIDCLGYAGIGAAPATTLWQRLIELDDEPSIDFLFA